MTTAPAADVFTASSTLTVVESMRLGLGVSIPIHPRTPTQAAAGGRIDHELLTRNIVAVARLARTFGLPIVLSTVNVRSNGAPPTLPELKAVLADAVEIDRTSINAWEDVEFRRAVQATDRRKLIITALWTEMCLAFPVLDALRAGYEVYPVVDAVGGTPPRHVRPGWSASPRPARSRSAGCPWPASSSATGPHHHRPRRGRHRPQLLTGDIRLPHPTTSREVRGANDE